MPTADTAPVAPGTGGQGPGLQDAAKAFSGLLDREGGTPAPKETADPPPEDQVEGDEVVAEGEAPEEETPPKDKPEGEDEGEPEGDEPAETDGEQPVEEAPKADPLHTVKVNGKEEQVSLDELLKGYSRHRDYTQKTDALATDRHVLMQERAEVLKERQQYAALLPALAQQLQTATEKEPDWETLYATNPLGWVKARDEWREKQDKLAAANFEMQRLAQVNEQEQQKSVQEMVVKGRARMLEMNPTWKDGKRWEADRQAIVEYASKPEVGYSREEIAQAYDPRAIVTLNKARLYDELMAKKPTASTQRQGPKVAGAGSAPVANNQNQRARQRLAQTGRIEDAAKVFMGLLDS